ncbi:MAG: hypothetical protein HZB16_22930 [Armatimonadetes bacterium]|nr:hypothetical protein [Armatimonadota bacterium]
MRRVVFALLLALLAVAHRPSGVSAAEGLRLLYPPNHSALAGPVRLMVASAKDDPSPSATLDGQALVLTRLAFADTWRLPGKLKVTAKLVGDRASAALWVATLDLKPGSHAVVVGGQRLDLWRDGDAARPAESARYYGHPVVGEDPPRLDCAGCHDQPDGALASAPTPKACAGCHDEDSVQLIHRHVSTPLARCATCHDPHGTTRPKMLVDTKQALCSRCHEAGHSKP